VTLDETINQWLGEPIQLEEARRRISPKEPLSGSPLAIDPPDAATQKQHIELFISSLQSSIGATINLQQLTPGSLESNQLVQQMVDETRRTMAEIGYSMFDAVIHFIQETIAPHYVQLLIEDNPRQALELAERAFDLVEEHGETLHETMVFYATDELLRRLQWQETQT